MSDNTNSAKKQKGIASFLAAAGGKQQENRDYTISRSFYRVWDKQNPLPRVGLKEAGAIEGTRSHYCYAAISTAGEVSVVCVSDASVSIVRSFITRCPSFIT